MVKNITVSYGIQKMVKKHSMVYLIFLQTKSVLRHLRLIPFKHSFPEKSLIEKNFLKPYLKFC